MNNRTWGAIAASATIATSLTFTSPSSAATDQTFARVKQVLGAADVGQTPGDDYGTADVTALTLPDGRIRLYFAIINGPAIHDLASAISSDGLTFTREPGVRVTAASSPMAFISKDGKHHLFYSQGGDIKSSTSNDGLTFTPDAGVRLAGDTFVKTRVRPNSNLICNGIAEMPDGRYRLYCAQQVQLQAGQTFAVADRAIFSAVSSDLVTWTPEAGRRIGPGTSLSGDANHPSVFQNSNGVVSLIYEQRLEGVDGREMIATSTDGLNFTYEYFSGIYGNEAAYTPGKDGKGYLYVGHHNRIDGSTIDVASPGPINLTNQKFQKSLVCIAQLPSLNPQVMKILADDPFCPKDYKEQVTTPTPTPTPTPSVTPTVAPTTKPKAITITCVKGKTVKKVSGTNPNCPAGYKKR